jgi:putative ABC transport system permease protein
MLWDMLRLALQAILRNPLRSGLTMLGVVIGVAAVITMVIIATGTSARVTSDLSRLGTNLLVIKPGQNQVGTHGLRSSASAFSLADSTALEREIPGLEAVAPVASRTLQVISGDRNRPTSVLGTTSAFLKVRDWPIDRGRGFTDTEEIGGQAVCIIGASVYKDLFRVGTPVGQRLRLGGFSCEVIGTLASKGESSSGSDEDDLILVPIRWFHRTIAGNNAVSQIFASARDGVDTTKVQADMTRLLHERRHNPSGADNFSVRDMREVVNAVTRTAHFLTGLLSAIAAVSLIVGGIGIMNVMFVSVTERTREIGIRLAIGALKREVGLQFLVEAVVLSSVGGVLGILLGLLGADLGVTLLGVPFHFQPGVILLAFTFSAAVGVVFGYFPARQAARLDPIEALRHE